MENNVNGGSYFDGGVLQFLGWSLLLGLISVLTFYIATPWGLAMFFKWQIGHTVIEGRRLKFTGTGGSLIGSWIKWILLTIITAGIYGLWVAVNFEKWKVSHIEYED